MDFLELCERNRDYLSRTFDDLTDHADVAARTALLNFADLVRKEGRIGVNMRPMVLLDLLSMDRWLNIHQWAGAVSTRGGKPIEEVLREKLKGYFDRRMAFDGFFESGFEFRYGALNIGGLGAHRFGEYCAIFHRDVVTQSSVGYLKGDSLNHYMAPGPEVDEDRLRSECATEACKHLLLTLKHAAHVSASPEAEWPDLVCNADCYAEAIVVHGSLRAAHLSCVRIRKRHFDLYLKYAYFVFNEQLSELDRFRVDAFAAIDEQLQALGVSWETV